MAWEYYAFADNNADGVGDAGSADLNGDGRVDSHVYDTNYDGLIDRYDTDPDGDGYAQVVRLDPNQDGVPEHTVIDGNRDGTGDTQTTDADGNGIAESITADHDGDGLHETAMDVNNQSGQLAGVYTPETGYVQTSGGQPAADPSTLGGSGAAVIGGADDYPSSGVGGSPTAIIGGTTSGGMLSPLIESSTIMNDPVGQNLVADLMDAQYRMNRNWTLPDGFEIVETDY